MKELQTPPEIAALIASNAPVAVGVSGGKDSVACAIAVQKHLSSVGHTGPVILVHADLGIVEWADSFPSCERVSKRIGVDLHVVRRAAGGMMERWESRWASSVRRYENLECVKLILPWSTPSMRFCTSELKSAPIASFLKKRFGKRPVISVTGIRADESANRAKMPAAKPNPRLHKGGMDWNPIIRWSVQEVFSEIRSAGLALHEAYTVFGSSRVSCAFCIMSKASDTVAAFGDVRNRPLHERMCALEIKSGFAFQAGRWLSELNPTPALAGAKELAELREAAESKIHKSLHFTKGWPERMPTQDEAATIAEVRRTISDLYGFKSLYLTQESVLGRYAELIQLKESKKASIAAIIQKRTWKHVT